MKNDNNVILKTYFGFSVNHKRRKKHNTRSITSDFFHSLNSSSVLFVHINVLLMPLQNQTATEDTLCSH